MSVFNPDLRQGRAVTVFEFPPFNKTDHTVVDREDLAQHVCKNEKYDEKRKCPQFCGTLGPGPGLTQCVLNLCVF